MRHLALSLMAAAKRRRLDAPPSTPAPQERLDTPPGAPAPPRGEGFVSIPADGDCGFQCFTEAGATEDLTTVAELRSAVADALTEDHLSALQAAAAADPRSYSYMRRCRSLDDLRTLTRPCGKDVGSRMCVWADWTHLQLMVDITGVTCLLRDQTSGMCLVMKPGNGTPPVPSSTTTSTSTPPRYLHIVRVDSVHFNLFVVGEKRLFTREEVKSTSLADIFDLSG